MKYRNIQDFIQTFFYFKASGSTDVLQINAAETGSKVGDCLDDLFRVLSIQTDGHCIDSSKFFEENSFSLHNGHSGVRSDISKTQNSTAVRDNSYRIGFHGIGISGFPIFRNHFAGLRYAGGIGKREIFSRFYR